MNSAAMQTSTSPGKPDTEEPELTQEESIPSDGKDHEGERLMEELGRERRKEDGSDQKQSQ